MTKYRLYIHALKCICICDQDMFMTCSIIVLFYYAGRARVPYSNHYVKKCTNTPQKAKKARKKRNRYCFSGGVGSDRGGWVNNSLVFGVSQFDRNYLINDIFLQSCISIRSCKLLRDPVPYVKVRRILISKQFSIFKLPAYMSLIGTTCDRSLTFSIKLQYYQYLII